MRPGLSATEGRRNPARHSIPALALVALLAALTAAAQAQVPAQPQVSVSPFELIFSAQTLGDDAQDQAARPSSGEIGPTEVGYESESWVQLAGAKFGKQKVIDGSPTPFELDLYDLSMRAHDSSKDGYGDERRGFAAGAECREEQPEPEAVEGCERVPVIYRLDVDGDGRPSLREAYRSERPGYVGKLVWIDRERALAVGGTGAYPRREPGCVIGSEGCPDPAGQGRAWLYDPVQYKDEDWHELAVPEAMRGLSAVGLDTRAGREGSGFAGAFAQIWRYEDGGFTKLYAQDTEEQTVVQLYSYGERAQRFRFRVRDVGFRGGRIEAVAVTAGCCASEEAQNLPQILYFDAATGKWYVYALAPLVRWKQESQPSIRVESVESQKLRRQSFYWLNAGSVVGLLASPDGSALAGAEEEGPWRCTWTPTGDEWATDNPSAPPRRPQCSGIDARSRLVSADSGPGGEWAVGEVKATGQGLARSGAPIPAQPGYYDFYPASLVIGFPGSPSYGKCPNDAGWPNLVGLVGGGDKTDLNTYQKQLARPQGLTRCEQGKSVYDPEWPFHRLSSYRLFAIDVDPETGGAWAVGAHGALLQLPAPQKPAVALSGAGAQGSAAATGQGERTPLPNREPYDAFRSPLSAEPSSLPALADRPLDRLPEGPRLVPGGYVGNADFNGQIVMSRDGSEGWALDGSNQQFELYHYRRSAWSRCVPGTDPACAGLTAPITRAARVPLENDPYLSNDDDFELVAIGGNEGNPRVFRYSGGGWSVDAEATGALPPQTDFSISFLSSNRDYGVAFTAPNERLASRCLPRRRSHQVRPLQRQTLDRLRGGARRLRRPELPEREQSPAAEGELY